MNGSAYIPKVDPYAGKRCGCGHLVYLDDDGACRFCSCLDHQEPS